MLHQPAGKDGGEDLRAHAEGVVIAGVFAHIRAAAHLHHHGVAVHVDERPGHPGQRKKPNSIQEKLWNRIAEPKLPASSRQPIWMVRLRPTLAAIIPTGI